ncbi:hypothetical protein I7I53_11911 [Histoplasma capsulatum var. duboisii H88]|uniref:Uncharacterized protein n=1 Tax=Ajellomyces capsulatus (strain H88) TaxID=544711 RepID=A0A8A1LWR8_AJEC8|nr:hypothetical protein I7I53_11911 [Histoplasma capsulatum var. duboisii H88]
MDVEICSIRFIILNCSCWFRQRQNTVLCDPAFIRCLLQKKKKKKEKQNKIQLVRSVECVVSNWRTFSAVKQFITILPHHNAL